MTDREEMTMKLEDRIKSELSRLDLAGTPRNTKGLCVETLEVQGDDVIVRIYGDGAEDRIALAAASLRYLPSVEIQDDYWDTLDAFDEALVAPLTDKVREEAAGHTIFQRGPSDVSGHARDCDWQFAAMVARTWDELAEALPATHPLAAIAANDGKKP